MARPFKNGLDYFPFDVDTENDDKIQLIEALHNAEGFAVIVKLWCKIYDNGYFYNWTEKEQLLFSKRVNVDINKVNAIINDAIKYGLFNAELFETHHILTSERIQRTFIEAIGRRKNVKIHTDYLLIDVNEHKNGVNVDIIGVNVDNKYTKESKVNIKEKEIKVNGNKTEIPLCDNDSEIDLILLNEILEYFDFTEMRNPDKKTQAYHFLKILQTDKRTDFFKEQFNGYKKFKDESGQIKHSFSGFLGTIEERFLDGGWNARNWQAESNKSNKEINDYNVERFMRANADKVWAADVNKMFEGKLTRENIISHWFEYKNSVIHSTLLMNETNIKERFIEYLSERIPENINSI